MARAFDSPQTGSSLPKRRFEGVFRREIAPHIATLDAERAKRRGQLIAIGVGTGLGLPALVAVLWRLDSDWAIAVGVIGLAIGVNLLAQQQRTFRHDLRRLVMPAICQAIGGGLRHQTGEAPGIPFEELESLGLLPAHDWRRIGDVFVGRHRATGFVLAEARLRHRNPHGRHRRRAVFRGLILALEVPREVPARILIARASGALGNRLEGWLERRSGLERVHFPQAEFEARFEVYADHPDSARDTVSPALCEALLRVADAHAGQPIQGAFHGRGFYLTMPRQADRFRLGSVLRSLVGLEQEAAEVLREIQIVHRVIDALHGGGPQSLPVVPQPVGEGHPPAAAERQST